MFRISIVRTINLSKADSLMQEYPVRGSLWRVIKPLILSRMSGDG